MNDNNDNNNHNYCGALVLMLLMLLAFAWICFPPSNSFPARPLILRPGESENKPTDKDIIEKENEISGVSFASRRKY